MAQRSLRSPKKKRRYEKRATKARGRSTRTAKRIAAKSKVRRSIGRFRRKGSRARKSK